MLLIQREGGDLVVNLHKWADTTVYLVHSSNFYMCTNVKERYLKNTVLTRTLIAEIVVKVLLSHATFLTKKKSLNTRWTMEDGN